MATPQHGDVLVRVFAESELQLVDAVTREQIAIVRSLNDAVALAVERRGAVWRENVDGDGRSIGVPILLLPKVSV